MPSIICVYVYTWISVSIPWTSWIYECMSHHVYEHISYAMSIAMAIGSIGVIACV